MSTLAIGEADLKRLLHELEGLDKDEWLERRGVSSEALWSFAEFGRSVLTVKTQEVRTREEFDDLVEGVIAMAFQVGFEACAQFRGAS